MQATWKTSLVAGIAFGVSVAIIGPLVNNLGALLVVLLLASHIFGIVGVTQWREMRAEQKSRGLGWFGVLAEPADFRRFYVPIWGRMLIWFVATAVSASLLSLTTPH